MRFGLPQATSLARRAATALCAALVVTACQDSPTTPAAKSETGGSTPSVTKQQIKAPKGVQYSSLTGQTVPDGVIVTYQGLEWVYASPCAPNGCTSGVLVGKDGFRYATKAEWAKFPPVSMFEGKCAAPWFDQTWDHCDFSNAYEGLLGSAPYGGQPAGFDGNQSMVYYAETFLVRGNSDNSAPVITPTVTGDLGDNGWYTSNVTVSWSVTDAESDVTSQTGCTSSTVSTDGAAFVFTCSATSSGGSDSKTVTIKRDATVPAVSFSGNAGAYTVADNVSITCSASDNLSGIASSSCPSASGAAYALGLGSHTLNANATDNAGNSNSASATFTVSVTAGSLCALTRSWVSSNGVANSMCAKLDAAAAANARGNTTAAQNQIKAYMNEVAAQSGKTVSAANAATLTSLASAL